MKHLAIALIVMLCSSSALAECEVELYEVGNKISSLYGDKKKSLSVVKDGQSHLLPRLNGNVQQILDHEFGLTIFWNDMSSVSVSNYEEEVPLNDHPMGMSCLAKADLDNLSGGVTAPYENGGNIVVFRNERNVFMIGFSKRLKKYLVSIYEINSSPLTVVSLNFDNLDDG